MSFDAAAFGPITLNHLPPFRPAPTTCSTRGNPNGMCEEFDG